VKLHMTYAIYKGSYVQEFAHGQTHLVMLLQTLGLSVKDVERGLAKLPIKGKFTSKGFSIEIVTVNSRIRDKITFQYKSTIYSGTPYRVQQAMIADGLPGLATFEHLCRINELWRLELGHVHYIPALCQKIEILYSKL
jgi:hypothetical protein